MPLLRRKTIIQIILVLLSSFFIIAIFSGIVITQAPLSESEVQSPVFNKSKVTFTNSTVWQDLDLNLDESVTVTTGGNLTIINCHINFTATDSGFILEDGGIITTKNSSFEYGGTGISGSSHGTITLLNSTFSSFSDDVIHVEGTYLVIIDQCLFQDNIKDAIQLIDTFTTANITNTLFLDNGKDGLNIEGVLLYVDECQIINSGDEGIQFDGSQLGASSIIVTNTVVNKTVSGDGVKIRGLNGSAFLDNVTVFNSGDDGIQVTQGPTDLLMQNTLISKSAEDGFESDSADSLVLSGCSFTDNDINGLAIRYAENVTFSNLFTSKNAELGLYLTNITSFILEYSNITANVAGGILLTTIQMVEIHHNYITKNTGIATGSSGLSTEGIHSISINHTIISDNSGSGIKLDNSPGIIFNNTITQNGEDGIALYNNTEALILNNTVSSNQGNGIYFTAKSTGIAHFNNISANGRYGILADGNRTDNEQIDANYNYWGSDAGPALELVSVGLQDDFQGPINVTYILTATGNVQVYIRPFQLDAELILTILVVFGVILAVIASAYGIYLRNRWLQEGKPQWLLLMSPGGLHVTHYTFVEERDDFLIISGFISAINSFSSALLGDSEREFQKKGGLEEIKHQEFTILLRFFGKWIIALVVSKSNPIIRRRLTSFNEFMPDFIKEYEHQDEVISTNEEQIEKFSGLAQKYFGDLVKKD